MISLLEKQRERPWTSVTTTTAHLEVLVNTVAQQIENGVEKQNYYLKKENEKLKKQNKKRGKKIKDLRSCLSGKDDERQQMVESMKEEKDEIILNLKKEIEELKQEIDELKQRPGGEEDLEELQFYKDQANDRQDQINDLEGQIDEQESEIKKLNIQINDLDGQVDEEENEIRRLKKELRNSKEEVQILKQKKHYLKKKLGNPTTGTPYGPGKCVGIRDELTSVVDLSWGKVYLPNTAMQIESDMELTEEEEEEAEKEGEEKAEEEGEEERKEEREKEEEEKKHHESEKKEKKDEEMFSLDSQFCFAIRTG